MNKKLEANFEVLAGRSVSVAIGRRSKGRFEDIIAMTSIVSFPVHLRYACFGGMTACWARIIYQLAIFRFEIPTWLIFLSDLIALCTHEQGCD
jgi:hypothetical protein